MTVPARRPPRSVGVRRERRLAALCMTFGAVLLGFAVVPVTTSDASSPTGNATLVDQNNVALTGAQTPTTLFAANLPAAASCPGNATAGYSVFTFMVPHGTDPTSISFSTGVPSNGLGYFDNSGSYQGGLNPSSTGQIIGLSNNLQWAGGLTAGAYTASDLAGGSTAGSAKTWDTGVACVKQGVMSSYWGAEITFTLTTTSFTWTTTSGLSGGGGSGGGAPTFTASSPPTTATVGTAYSYTFTASGTPTPTFAVKSGSGTLPAGLTLSSGGVLSGNPTTAGSSTFVVEASNSAGTVDTSSITITVAAASTSTTSTSTSTTSTSTTSTSTPTTSTSTAVPCATSTSTTSTTPSSTSTTSASTTTTSTTSTSTTSTSTTSAPSATTAPCSTSTTATDASSTAAASSGATGGSTTGSSLPFTGSSTRIAGIAGVFLMGVGLVFVAAARRREELDRMAWPDEQL